jgi:hypothetical protein
MYAKYAKFRVLENVAFIGGGVGGAEGRFRAWGAGWERG